MNNNKNHRSGKVIIMKESHSVDLSHDNVSVSKKYSYSLLGQKRIMNCGMEAKVIEDNGCEDITVQFSDGTIKTHCSRHNFLRGKIRNRNIKKGCRRS